MASKYSTKMHEVYDSRYRLIRYCGSRGACLRYASNSPYKSLEVRVAGR